MTETTTEQLAEIEGQAESTPVTGYTPPEGWRVLAVGELLQPGDHWVNWEGTVSRPDIQHGDGATVSGGRYIRWVKPQPQPDPQPQSQPEPVPEPDAELRIRLLQQANDSQAETIGRLLSEARDLNMEIGGLERQLVQRDARIRDLETMHAAASQAVVDAGKVNDKLRAQIEELRSEVSYVQRLLGESRQRVTQLEELVGSLRTINEAQEQAFTAAGQDNTALRNQLAAVKAELVQERLERNRWHNQVLRVTAELDEKTTQCEILQIELDAAQQVPAGLPELRQLRADLAEVTRERDQYLDSYQRIFGDLETIRETTKAETVETIAEWLQAFRGCNSPALALLLLEALPSIMRHLTGLTQD